MMTPTLAEVKAGVYFLGLGTEDERFCAPYYWFLPSIAYLDYDHQQRLFLKNLKYETRDLTFWEGKDTETRVATIQHLKDLRNRCEKAGLDTGITAMDLVLIYFFDQNSDACERIFTQRIADLLDDHVPGSQGTSLYIRAVTHLIEPFRNPRIRFAGRRTEIDILRYYRVSALEESLRTEEGSFHNLVPKVVHPKEGIFLHMVVI